MESCPLEGAVLRRVLPELARSPLFESLTSEQLSQLAAHGTLCTFEPGELLMEQGARSDSFFVLLRGSVSIRITNAGGEPVEIAAHGPVTTLGEIGLLLEQPRSASVVVIEPAEAMRFEAKIFSAIVQKIPAFGLALCRVLASRATGRQAPGPDSNVPDPAAATLLPIELMQRHQMLPLKLVGNVLTVGFVHEPTPAALSAVRIHTPGMELRTCGASARLLEVALASRAATPGWSAVATGAATATGAAPAQSAAPRSPRLDALLRRMVAEGASDLHLSGGQRPHWRVDGEIHELADVAPLAANEVLELLTPVMQARAVEEFARDHDADFAYALPGTARFRTNLFRDHRGVSAVLRQIPDKILSFEQLGLPPAARALCEFPKGLVLVTGPSGSGKSTTLAAMVDFINRTRRAHIITLEDPIEFVHPSRMSLVNQREVGAHTTSFARALKAALREDPDIVLVGEMRDLETVSLALETANTGHLVFGTLHTSTAVSTVDRIVNVFRAEQQAQIRATLADVLRGVIAQTLCRKTGGGRIAALEILMSSSAVANLIREGKTQQIPTAMTTGKAAGNQMLNEELARLVLAKKVEPNEALHKAVDKADLVRRLGVAAS
ncbi:MAG: PilT/PilU family type 4a pilus ATPase [Myxococcales bacterium]|nr:PilT/PilU family type 4a pilus ATPase [Myxococcales bacterium]